MRYRIVNEGEGIVTVYDEMGLPRTLMPNGSTILQKPISIGKIKCYPIDKEIIVEQKPKKRVIKEQKKELEEEETDDKNNEVKENGV